MGDDEMGQGEPMTSREINEALDRFEAELQALQDLRNPTENSLGIRFKYHMAGEELREAIPNLAECLNRLESGAIRRGDLVYVLVNYGTTKPYVRRVDLNALPVIEPNDRA